MIIEELLKETGALLNGHFLLSSGLHSDGYVQCARLLQYPDKAEKVIEVLAEKVKDLDIDLVVGPAMGGVIVAYELARQLGKPAIFTERDDQGNMSLRRGFEIKKGTRVLITEDVVTSGKSSLEAIKVVEEHGGEVIGITCIVDRTSAELEYPLYGGLKLNLKTYTKDECPMCKEDMELVKPGSRKIK